MLGRYKLEDGSPGSVKGGELLECLRLKKDSAGWSCFAHCFI
jgi:hypothetical protein